MYELTQDKNWEILETSKNKVDQFRRTMPLISDLKNKAMRPRHWEQIQAETGRSFDSASDEFTLERIIEWGFDQYNEKINEIAGAAVKELAIEQGLNDISNTWEGIELDLVPYKDKGHYKLRYVGASSSTSCHTRARATTSSGIDISNTVKSNQ